MTIEAMPANNTRASRPRHEMPAFIQAALDERGLVEAYHNRPAYQQNDYIGWVTRAVNESTIQKRLNQMLDELEAGDVYMKMAWNPR
jgi:hypothetical protein